jgi:peptidylamidoglycolate lyase
MNRNSRVWIAAAAFAAAICSAPASAAESNSKYRLVENWAQFPPGVTKWGPATGVDVDAHDNVYVLQRNPAMPVMVFDSRGKFLRGWGQGMFPLTHFLRVDRSGNVWATDREFMVAYKFSPEGKLLLTLGKKGVKGDNESHDAFDGVADVAVAANGHVFVADGEGANTRVVEFTPEGQFVRWWGGKGKEPGKFDTPHSIVIDATGTVYVADRGNNRIQIFDQSGRFLKQWTNFGTPWGLFVKGNRIYEVDGTDNNWLIIAGAKDGKVQQKITGLSNATAVAVDSKGSIYVGEVNGANVKKYVRK